MQFYNLALISAVACATGPSATIQNPTAPSFSPSTVNATKLTSVELSLPWEISCSKEQNPSFKISIDAEAIKKGAFISANATDGIEVQGFQGDKGTKISGKSESDVKKDNLTSLVFSFEKSDEKTTVKANILYLAQKVDANKTVDTFFDIDLVCNGKTFKSYNQTNKSAPILKVSSATSAPFTVAAAFLSSLYLVL